MNDLIKFFQQRDGIIYRCLVCFKEGHPKNMLKPGPFGLDYICKHHNSDEK